MHLSVRSIITFILLIFVGTSLVYLITKNRQSDDSTQVTNNSGSVETASDQVVQALPHQVEVYYLHGNKRCVSFRTIEAYSHEAIRTAFRSNLKDGSVLWRVINFEEAGNQHYVDEFKLVTQSLVIIDKHNGQRVQWKNLGKVWELLNDKEGFFDYVQREVQSFMDDA